MSKKYVIELDDRIKLVTSVGVTENGVVYTTSDYVHNLEELNSDYINENFGELQDAAYQKGYDAGIIASSFVDKSDEAYQKGYEEGRKVGIKDGMCEAWEAAKKIVADTDHGGFDWDALGEIFDTQNYTHIMSENTAQGAIDKIKAYEDKQKEDDSIKVGDCVYEKQTDPRDVGVVTWVSEDASYVMWKDGSSGMRCTELLCKTGKHYDIQSILEAMRK